MRSYSPETDSRPYHDNHPTHTRRRVLQSVGALSLTGLLSVFSRPVAATGAADYGDEFLLGFEPTGDVQATIDVIAASLPAKTSIVHQNETLGYVKLSWNGPAESIQTTEHALQELVDTHDAIQYVERNATCTLDTDETVADTGSSRFDDQYAPQLVNAPAAWETTRGSTDVTIGIIDSAVEYDHPTLTDQFGETKGYDFVNDTADPAPGSDSLIDYHGTHVAGIAAATNDNGVGIKGISNSRLLAARVFNPWVTKGNVELVADAITYLVDSGADIINMSFSTEHHTETFSQAIDYAVDHDVLLLTTAGNKGDNDIIFPATHPDVLTVSAVGIADHVEDPTNVADEDIHFRESSQYGPEVDVCAPGEDILSTGTGWWIFTPGYRWMSGTSQACPLVAGVAALALSKNPDLTASEVADLIRDTAREVDGLTPEQQGAGLVDAAAVVDHA